MRFKVLAILHAMQSVIHGRYNAYILSLHNLSVSENFNYLIQRIKGVWGKKF